MDDLPGQAHPDGTAIEPLLAGPEIEHIRRSMGYRLHERSGTRVRATLSLDAAHHQHFGGCTAASTRSRWRGSPARAPARPWPTGVCAGRDKQHHRLPAAVDVDQLEVVAEPLFQGRTQQLWQVSISRDRDGKLVARGQLRLQNLPLSDDRGQGADPG